jgi:hypothetical protein
MPGVSTPTTRRSPAARRVAREQRADVGVGTQAHEHEVERLRALGGQLALVVGRPVLGAELALHAVDVRPLDLRQERLVDHAEVRVLVVGGHAALVGEPDIDPGPVAAPLGGELVGMTRSGAAGKDHMAAGGHEQLAGGGRGIVGNLEVGPGRHFSIASAQPSART